MLPQTHVNGMDILNAGVSMTLTVAIFMRVSFTARIADDDHMSSTLHSILPHFHHETRATQQQGTERVAYGQNQTALGLVSRGCRGGSFRSCVVVG